MLSGMTSEMLSSASRRQSVSVRVNEEKGDKLTFFSLTSNNTMRPLDYWGGVGGSVRRRVRRKA